MKTAHVLHDSRLRALFEDGSLRSEAALATMQPASFDIPLAAGMVYEVAGFPSIHAGFSVAAFVEKYSLNRYRLMPGEPLVLSRDRVYLLPLDIDLALPEGVMAVANPKSSAGRIDLFTTVIGEVGERDRNVLRPGYQGKLWVVVIPQSFPVKVAVGEAFVQLRVIEGKHRHFLSGSELQEVHQQHPVVFADHSPEFIPEGVLLHLSLGGSPSNLVSNRVGKVLDTASRKSESPIPYFREKPKDEWGSITLEPGEFALVETIERLAIPPTHCAEMVAFDDRQGEMRTHYAGFFDPGFGWNAPAQKGAEKGSGSGVVCELRNLGAAPIILTHGQPICCMRFEILAGEPERLYGNTLAGEASNYQFQQGVKMAKFFSPSPDSPATMKKDSAW